MSCQPHRVTSGQSNSGHKQIHISKLFSHIYQPSVKSIYKTKSTKPVPMQTQNITYTQCAEQVVSGYGWSVQGRSLVCPCDLCNGLHAASGLPKWKTVAWGLTLRGTGRSNSNDWSSTTAISNTKGERIIHEWSLTENSAQNWDLDLRPA